MYCTKCSEEIAPSRAEDVLDENRDCMLCGLPKVCPKCSREQEKRFADFPLIVCMDCIGEADEYLKRIDEVSASINAIMRHREENGFVPEELVMDATMQDRDAPKVRLTPSLKLKLDPVPMVFAVYVLSRKQGDPTSAVVDYVPLCPSAIKRTMSKALREVSKNLGVRLSMPEMN
jgi:hypothetical protein